MVFQLKQLFHREGDVLPVDYEIPPQALSQIRGYRFDQPVHVTGAFRNRAGIVTLELTVSCMLTAECDRCLELFHRPYSFSFTHTVVLSVNRDNDEYIVAQDAQLDVDEVALTDLLLQLPTKLLCREDCRGLCPGCGVNLNYEVCRCKKEVDPRLAKLAQLLDRSENK